MPKVGAPPSPAAGGAGGLMRLYIGKNHEEDTAPVQSIFRLAGNDEDALTYALGFLLARDHNFCAQLVRRLRVAPRRPLSSGYSVHLQEITAPGFGRRDIVIQDGAMRIVLEAKIGGAEPTTGQLRKYVDECKLWNKFTIRAVVALTQVELSAATKKGFQAILSEKAIQFSNIQWHEVVDLALSYRHSDGSEASRYLFDEFIRYIMRDYRMGYYDAEILIQDVNPRNAEIFTECWMYVTSLKDKKAPLYFAPYFTKQGEESGISMISRVRDTEVVILAGNQDVAVDSPSGEHLERWRRGLAEFRKLAKKVGFSDYEVRLFYLDQPMKFRTTPITKKSFSETGPSKKIPSQIPKGFSLGFDDLLIPCTDIGKP